MNAITAETAERLGVQVPHLAQAAEFSEQAITDARTAVNDYLAAEGCEAPDETGLSVVAYGSLGRFEATPASDLDVLVIAHELGSEPRLIRTFRTAGTKAQERLGIEPHGRSGLFGGLVGWSEMVNSIGLDADSNINHSRRILTLQESVALSNLASHDLLVRAIVDRYLDDYRGREEPYAPRFLLNDITRYWRTVAVDYQAKRWDELADDRWGSRYLKLRTTRKLAYAGLLAASLHPLIKDGQTSAAALVDQFHLPSVARLAQLHDVVGDRGKEALRTILIIADEAIGWFSDRSFRDEIAGVAEPRDATPDSRFAGARARSVDLQNALVDLFFDSETIGHFSLEELSRKYLTF